MIAKFEDAKDSTKSFEVNQNDNELLIVINGNDAENPYAYMDFNLPCKEIPHLVEFLNAQFDAWQKRQKEGNQNHLFN